MTFDLSTGRRNRTAAVKNGQQFGQLQTCEIMARAVRGPEELQSDLITCSNTRTYLPSFVQSMPIDDWLFGSCPLHLNYMYLPTC